MLTNLTHCISCSHEPVCSLKETNEKAFWILDDLLKQSDMTQYAEGKFALDLKCLHFQKNESQSDAAIAMDCYPGVAATIPPVVYASPFDDYIKGKLNK